MNYAVYVIAVEDTNEAFDELMQAPVHSWSLLKASVDENDLGIVFSEVESPEL